MVTADIDIRGFSRFVEGLQNALVGTHQDGGDLLAVVKSEVRQLAVEISKSLGPADKGKGEAAIARSVRTTFMPGPENVFTGVQAGGKHGMKWLYAGTNYLVGVANQDVANPQIATDEMLAILRARQNTGLRTKMWIDLGQHGKQHVKQINRTLVTRQRYDPLLKTMGLRVGRLRAIFAWTAHELGFKQIPSWVSRHFKDLVPAEKAIFRYKMEGTGIVAIEFGGIAPGLVSNEHIVSKINSAVERRKYFLVEKIKKILAGHRADLETGAVFKSNRGEQMLKQLEANEELFNSI